MSFLLDTDICSVHVKRPSGLTHRFIQHAARLFIPTIVLAELHVWVHQRADPYPLLRSIEDDLLQDVIILDFDRPVPKSLAESEAGCSARESRLAAWP